MRSDSNFLQAIFPFLLTIKHKIFWRQKDTCFLVESSTDDESDTEFDELTSALLQEVRSK